MSLFDLAPYGITGGYALGALGNFLALPLAKEAVRKLASLCIMAGFAMHSMYMLALLLLRHASELSKGDFLQFMAWCLLLVYYVCRRRWRLAYLSLTLAPCALLLCIASLRADSVKAALPSTLGPLFFLLHIASVFLALALLASGFGVAIFFLRMENKIKNRADFSAFDDRLPALSTCDMVNAKAVLWGFPLYTLGIVAGFLWAKISWGHMLSWDPKELFSLGIWFLFALLFHQRLALGWQGKKAALMLIGLFTVSLLSVMANFFLVSHHSFF